MEGSIVESLCSLGVGAALAGVIFFMYRIDRKATEERMDKLFKQTLDNIKENTQATQNMNDLLKNINGKLTDHK